MSNTGGEANTLGAVFRSTVTRFPDRPALKFPAENGFQTLTYRQYEERVRRFASALLKWGLQKGDRLAIQAENCGEWMTVDWACQTLGITLVPIYTTLPADQTEFILTDSQAKIVVVGTAELAQKITCTTVKMLKGSEGSLSDEANQTEPMSSEQWNASIDGVCESDLATLIYTSGTTGNPKGVMLPQRAPTWLCRQITENFPIDQNDTFFSFLPLSHVFGRLGDNWLPVSCGACVGHMKSLASMANDMSTVQPTIFLSVPRFLEALKERIEDGVKKQPPLRQKLFHAFVSQGLSKSHGKFAPMYPILKAIVGKKLKARVGGKLRFFVSGGAALPKHVGDFYEAIDFPIVQGYGLTETTAATTLNPYNDRRHWTVGKPIGDCEVKIATDGEILIRGISIMDGYFNLPEATAEAIDSEGWFHTGDIGEWEDGYLKITDRKKDLLVLANGKNIAPQVIENRMRESALIQEMVLFGDGSEYVYGLVIPNWENVAAALPHLNLNPSDVAALAQNDEVKKLIKQTIDGINKTLAPFEVVKRHAVVDAKFSVETGELTPSLKVKRKVIKERYADVLATLAR